MTTVARLLPRDWDGRRLLQFLTGLALIALAFALPALLSPAGQPAESPVTVITTVDTPLPPGLPLTEVPAQPGATNDTAGLILSAETTTAQSATSPQAAAAAAGTSQAAASTTGADTTTQTADNAARAAQGAGVPTQGVVQGHTALVGLPLQGRRSGRICVEARAAIAGATQSAHSERGPPRA